MMSGKVALYCSSDSLGGLEKHTIQVLQWLNERGNKISLITTGKSPMNCYAAGKGIPVSEIPFTERFLSIGKAHNLASVVRREQFDILFIIRPRDIATAVLVRSLFRRNLVLIFYQLRLISLHGNRRFYSLLFRPFRFWLVAMKFLATEMNSLRYPKSSRIRVVHPCIDTTYFNNSSLSRAEARKMLNLPSDTNILGVLGRLSEEQKHDFVIRAVQFLKMNDYRTDLLIMGPAKDPEQEEYEQFLQLLVKECNLERHVHFRSYPPNMPVFFSAVDAFVVNKFIRPYDTAIIKSLASGVPVIAEASETNNYLLEEGRVGLLYNPNDLEDFAAKVIHILTQEKIREHFRIEGPVVAREKYNKDEVCKQLEEIILLVLRR